MSLLDKMERRWGRYAINNIAIYFVIGQVFVLLTSMLGKMNIGWLILVPQAVLEGQWWRVFTYLLVPPPPGLGRNNADQTACPKQTGDAQKQSLV